MLGREEVKAAAEAVLFVCGQAVSLDELVELLDIPLLELKPVMEELIADYRSRRGGLQIVAGADGYLLCTNPEYADVLSRLSKTNRKRLSQAALETLAIIAYKQPVTKTDVDQVRGVKSDKVIGNLLEMNLIAAVGHKPVLGNPALYGTTADFLSTFGLASIGDLPANQEE